MEWLKVDEGHHARAAHQLIAHSAKTRKKDRNATPTILSFWGTKSQKLVDDVLIWDYSANSWATHRKSTIAKQQETIDFHPNPRSEFAITGFQEKFYVFGGYENIDGVDVITNVLWEYDATQNTLSKVGKKPCDSFIPPRAGHSLTYVPKGKENGPCLYLFGGSLSFEKTDKTIWSKFFNQVLQFNFKTNEWKYLEVGGTKPTGRVGHSAVYYETKDGKEKRIVIFGGSQYVTGGKYLSKCNDIVYLDLVKNEWKYPNITENIPKARNYHSCALFDSKMYIFGGYHYAVDLSIPNLPLTSEALLAASDKEWKASETTAVLNVFDLISEKWLVDAPKGIIPKSRAGHSAVMINNQMLLFGGCTKFPKDVDEEYLTLNDTWVLEIGCPLPPPKLYAEKVTKSSILLNWHDSTSFIKERNYTLQVKFLKKSPWITVYEGSDTQYELTKIPMNDSIAEEVLVSANCEYMFRLSCSNSVGSSDYWINKSLPGAFFVYPDTACTVRTLSPAAPSAIKNGTLVQESNIVKLAWSPLETWGDGVGKGYEVEVSCNNFTPDIVESFKSDLAKGKRRLSISAKKNEVDTRWKSILKIDDLNCVSIQIDLLDFAEDSAKVLYEMEHAARLSRDMNFSHSSRDGSKEVVYSWPPNPEVTASFKFRIRAISSNGSTQYYEFGNLANCSASWGKRNAAEVEKEVHLGKQEVKNGVGVKADDEKKASCEENVLEKDNDVIMEEAALESSVTATPVVVNEPNLGKKASPNLQPSSSLVKESEEEFVDPKAPTITKESIIPPSKRKATESPGSTIKKRHRASGSPIHNISATPATSSPRAGSVANSTHENDVDLVFERLMNNASNEYRWVYDLKFGDKIKTFNDGSWYFSTVMYYVYKKGDVFLKVHFDDYIKKQKEMYSLTPTKETLSSYGTIDAYFAKFLRNDDLPSTVDNPVYKGTDYEEGEPAEWFDIDHKSCILNNKEKSKFVEGKRLVI